MHIFALVIDDEAEAVKHLLLNLQARMSERGHSLAYHLAADVRDACEGFTEWNAVDLVWLDLVGVIRNANLLEGLREEIPLLRARNSLVPLLIVSKQTLPDVIIQAIDLGASSYVMLDSVPSGAWAVYQNDATYDLERWDVFVEKIVGLAERYQPFKRTFVAPRAAGVFRKTGRTGVSEAITRQFAFLEAVAQYEDLRGLFPEIISRPVEQEGTFTYETEYFEMPTLRSLLFRTRDQSEVFRVGEAVLAKLLDRLFERLYTKRLGTPAPDFVDTWYRRKYTRRLEEAKTAVAELRRAAEAIADARTRLAHELPADVLRLLNPRRAHLTDLRHVEWLLDAKSVRDESAAITWRSPGDIIEELLSLPGFQARVTPPRTGWVHGDLHLANILVDCPHPDFVHIKLIDPGGYIGGLDPAYDIGKLLHSLHGDYDFIHAGYLHVRSVTPGATPGALITDGFDFADWSTVPLSEGGSGDISETLTRQVTVGHQREFRRLAAKLESYIDARAFFGDDRDWRLRSHFHEAMHFCTMAKFHLSDSPARTASIILRGFQLMNEFYDDYKNGKFD